MKYCCICGNTLNILKGSSVIDFQEEKYEMCDICTKNRIKLTGDDISKIKAAKEYFEKNIENEKTEKKAIALVKSYVNKAEAKINGYEEPPEVSLYKNMKLTSGYNFEGYKIIEYIDVISTSVVRGTGFKSEVTASFSDFWGEESKDFAKKMDVAKKSAKEKLKKLVVEIGGNAVIGMKYDMFTIGTNMMAVSASGTAVRIEKIENNELE